MVYTNKQLLDIAANVIEDHGGKLDIMEIDEDEDLWVPRVVEQPDDLDDLSISVDCGYGELKLCIDYWQESIPHEDMKGLIEELHTVKKIFDEIMRRTKS